MSNANRLWVAGIFFAIAGFGDVSVAANRCTDAQGKVTYQEEPCPRTQSEAVVRLQAGPETATTKDFGSSDAAKLINLKVLIDHIRSMATDCRIKLQVYKREQPPCDSLARYLGQGNELFQANEMITYLGKKPRIAAELDYQRLVREKLSIDKELAMIDAQRRLNLRGD